MRRRLGAAALLVAALAAVAALALSPRPVPQDAPIEARPLALDPRDPARTRLGALVYAGGLSLSSSRTGRLGGVSDVQVEVGPSGQPRALAVTDEGDLLDFDLILDPAGRLTGVGPMRYTALVDEAGAPLPGKGLADAEDLARLPDGGYAVAFEQLHRVMAVGRPLEAAKTPRRLNMPPEAARLPQNGGFEALAALDGDLIVGAEDGRIWRCPIEAGACRLLHDRGGPSAGYLLTSLEPVPGSDHELVAVYRSVNLFGRSFSAIIAHVDVRTGKAAVTPLARLSPPLSVHNMEGISAVPTAGGVRLYLISDNGFGRTPTLLMAFDWLRPQAPAPGRRTPP